MSERSERLYGDALALPAASRAAFVRAACPRDPGLQAEILSLLARADAAEAFFGRLGEAVVSDVFWSGESDGSPDLRIDGVPEGTEAPADTGALPAGHILGHYRILERIGTGGMGTLYRAHDTRLGRAVALKFLPPQPSTGEESRERLLSEARAAAALEHPNVCAIHEVGETEDGRPFIAMPFYRGETLKERLRRGPLPAAEAAAVARQLAAGLAAAHASGIVHGDIKPANVMLTADGTVKLLDFGLAETGSVVGGRPGGPWGTLPYMSPERVGGGPTDPQSDLWSMGAVLYEMLTGAPPFRAASELVLLREILRERPEPVSTLAPATPEPLARIVDRLLRKEPGARYESAGALGADLGRAVPSVAASRVPALVDRRGALTVGGLAALALVLGLGGLWLAGWGRRASSAAALGASASPGVTVGPAGPGAAGTGVPVGAAGAQEALRRRTTNVAAYELYLRGNDQTLLRSDTGVLRGVQYFQQAIALDSGYAAAHAGLAVMYVSLRGRDAENRPDRELRAMAERAASRAVALQDSLAEGHAALALVRLYSDYDYRSAEAEFRRALELDPTRPVYHEWLAQLLIMTGRPAEALRSATRSLDIDPMSPTAYAEVAHALLANGREDEALSHLERIAGLRPPLLRARVYLAEAYAMKRMWPEAAATLRGQWKKGKSTTAGLHGYILGRAGRRDEALHVREDLLERWRRGTGNAFSIGVVEAGLGDYDRAFAWLDRAVDDRSAMELIVNIMSPAFEELRADPRFERLRGRLGLEGA